MLSDIMTNQSREIIKFVQLPTASINEVPQNSDRKKRKQGRQEERNDKARKRVRERRDSGTLIVSSNEIMTVCEDGLSLETPKALLKRITYTRWKLQMTQFNDSGLQECKTYRREQR